MGRSLVGECDDIIDDLTELREEDSDSRGISSDIYRSGCIILRDDLIDGVDDAMTCCLGDILCTSRDGRRRRLFYQCTFGGGVDVLDIAEVTDKFFSTTDSSLYSVFELDALSSWCIFSFECVDESLDGNFD